MYALFLLFLWFSSWIIGYVLFVLIYKKTGEHEKYEYPKIFAKTIWISSIYSLIMFLAIQSTKLVLGAESSREFIDAFSFFTSIVLAIFPALTFTWSLRKPRHNQDESVSIPLRGSVSELREISSKKFPNVSVDHIQIFRTPENIKSESLSILPLPKWTKKDEIVANPVVTIGYLEYLAKQKDPTMKKVSIDYSNGIPFLFTE